ncbi:hypothetical protein PG994_003092 [Apiospora phragmitis]|uniref:UBC core domain-containing protein n=1 Tax=Apiospora phragmitis TaxID=2905665 RepID=A0ABR1W714_9PEZI
MQSWDSRVVKIAQSYREKPLLIAELRINPIRVQSFGDYHRENALAEIPDAEVLNLHYYKSAAEKVAKGSPPRQRMKRVVREIMILQTSLPEGIFVRHGGSRPDVLKVLIIGPQGTPYEDGFFLFDMFLPLDFPQKPPSLRLRTATPHTSFFSGFSGFNPNLYVDGHREPWRPEQSTLLQVLVSVQAMILCPNPYYNEPHRTQNDAESAKYNKKVREMTVDAAIIPWVRATAREHGGHVSRAAAATGSTTSQSNFSPLWKDVAVKYFVKDSKYRKH